LLSFYFGFNLQIKSWSFPSLLLIWCFFLLKKKVYSISCKRMSYLICLSSIELDPRVCKLRRKETFASCNNMVEFWNVTPLSICISLNHCKAWNNLNASPTFTRHKGEKLIVFVKTKAPSSSRTHMPIHVPFHSFEKDTPILHLILPPLPVPVESRASKDVRGYCIS